MLATGPGGRLLGGIAAVLAALAAIQLGELMRLEPPGMDLLPLWTAGRMVWTQPGKVYDFAAVTAAQAWLLPPHFAWLRPYADPPTTLLLAAPLGRLPYWIASGIWLALSLGVYLLAAARLAGRSMVLAALIAVTLPAVAIAVIAGQTVVLASGLIVLAVLELPRRPRLAGVLIAIAAIAKPQAAIMAPVGLLACGAFEALISAGLVAAVAAAASAILFGPGRWSAWFASFGGYQHMMENLGGLGSVIVTPFWAARELGLPGPACVSAATAFALAGAWLTWRCFRKAADPARRVGALAVGGLFAAPYALYFDATLVAPAATALAVVGFSQGRTVGPALALAAAFLVATPYLGLLSLLAFAALVLIDRAPAAALDAAGARMAPSAGRL
jgi:alpha-1,2-mannosyltransferase